MQIDRIVTATGSAGTHAGLVAGLAVMGADIPVLGIGVRAPKEKQEANVLKLAKETAALLGRPDAVTDAMVVADCDYVGAGYGLVDEAVIEALKLAARTDGIVLDPVYTGKAMKGLIALARAGRFENETVVFLHTGGGAGAVRLSGRDRRVAVKRAAILGMIALAVILAGGVGLMLLYRSQYPAVSKETVTLGDTSRARLILLRQEAKFEPNAFPPLGYTGPDTPKDGPVLRAAVNDFIDDILAQSPPSPPSRARPIAAGAWRATCACAGRSRRSASPTPCGWCRSPP
jgi:hypothetical protein